MDFINVFLILSFFISLFAFFFKPHFLTFTIMIVISFGSFVYFKEKREEKTKDPIKEEKKEKIEKLNNIVLSLLRNDLFLLDQSETDFLNKNNVFLDFSKGIGENKREIYFVIHFKNLNKNQCYFYSNHFNSEWSVNEMIINRFLFKPFDDPFLKEESRLIDLSTSPTPINIENACFARDSNNSLRLIKYIK